MHTICRSAFAAYWNRGKLLLESDVGSIGPFGYCGGIADGVGFELGVMLFSTHCLFVLSLKFAPDRHMQGTCHMFISIWLKGIPGCCML